MRATLGDRFFPTASGYRACITAGGVNLKHGGRPARALAAFRQLPKSQRAAGAVRVGALDPVDERVRPAQPPVDGMILKVHARLMRRETGGSLGYVSQADFPRMADFDDKRLARSAYLFESSVDHAWLLPDEWRAFVVDVREPGQVIEASRDVVQRLCRFHLIPQRIYAEGGEWPRKQIRGARLAATVLTIRDDRIEFGLTGFARLGSEYDAAIATTPNGKLKRGYECEFEGRATYDRKRRRFVRFDLLAVGDSWGRMGDANGKSVSVERPLRAPLVFAFALVDGSRPVDRLVPMGRASKLVGHRYLNVPSQAQNRQIR